MQTTRLDAVFDANARRLDSRIAVRESGADWTYGRLASRSGGIADSLRTLGVRPGSRVGLMFVNSGAFVASFFGAVKAGGVVAPLNPRYRKQELTFYLADCSAHAVLVGKDHAAYVEDAVGDMDPRPALVIVDADGVVSETREAAGRRSPGTGETALLQQYTSGSTGQPKRVIRTHANLLAELEQLSGTFGLGECDRFLGVAPFSHVNGLVRTMLTSMFVGGTLYPLPEFRRRDVLHVIAEERITYFGGVPTMYVILATTPVRGSVDLSSLRVAFSSSAPLMTEDNERFAAKYGVVVRQLYGSTETGTISVNTDANAEDHPASVGRPLPGVRVEIVAETGGALGPDVEGEVAIASPWAITAYDGNPEANTRSFRDGVYLSGDLGYRDGEGRLTLTGRKKFLINRAGYEVNPFEVEQAVLSHPKVAEVVVLGSPTRHGDEAIRCVIVANAPCSVEEIVDHCRERIADYKIPGLVEFMDALPKTPTGKVLRSKLI